MKLLFISQHYKPEPCDTRTSQLAEALAKRGHEASVITTFPNYPFGKVYDGYRQQLREKKVIDGVNVLRVPMYPDHSKSAKKRALSYLSFGLSGGLLGTLFAKRPDLLWIHHPPLTTGIAGYVIAKLKRVPYVYEIHDLWPETLVSTGMIREGRLTQAVRKVCNFLHRGASAILVSSPGMKTHLERQGVPPEKVHVFPQWADEEIYRPVEREAPFGAEHGLDGKFNVIFAGNLGIAQSLDTVLDAASILQDVPNLQVLLVGEGVESERLRRRVQDEGITNVRFLGHHPASSMPQFFAWADGLLIHLQNDPLFAITIPSKTQTYMACGRPILCGVAGDGAEVVDQASCGFTFEPDNAFAMAEAIRRLASTPVAEREQLGINARAAFLENFGKAGLIDRYERLFESILKIAPTEAVVQVEERIAA